jgi:multiple sugar transport system permease protein
LAPGLGVALLLNAGSRVVEAVRTAFILPMVLPAIVVAVVWKVILDTALAAIAVADTWEWFPFTMLMVLAALQMIPGEPIDAARIDGAGRLAMLENAAGGLAHQAGGERERPRDSAMSVSRPRVENP